MKKILNLCLIAVMCMLIFAGCGNKQNNSDPATMESDPGRADNVIIMAGNHANAVKPDYSTLSDILEEVALNSGNISVIVTDGKPFISCDISIPEQKRGLSDNKKKTIASSQADQIIEFLGSEQCLAKTEGLAILQSFELVSRISKTDDYMSGITELYIYDSGLSTVQLDLSDVDLNRNEAEDIVLEMKEADMIPDLSSIEKVCWYGICDVSGDQEKLSNMQVEKVKAIWKELLEEAGTEVDYRSDISTGQFGEELPYIKPVPSCTTALEWNDSGETEEGFPETLVFDEEIIGFEPGTACLLDVEQAKNALEKTAEYLIEHKEFRVLMVGSTACWGTRESCIALSEERCAVVRELLVQLGANDAQIITKGMGFDSPFYKDDKGAEGYLDESIAPSNRVTVLMDADCELARSICDNTWKE